MYTVVLSHKYKRSLKRIHRHKHFNQLQLETLVNILASNGRLEAKYKDHQLIGSMKEYRECHIQNDLLLVYQRHDDILILLLIDIGSHSEVFG